MTVNNKKLLGSVVAFEGHSETISTQLRLLPTSPQILILPSIHYYISKVDLSDDFDARTFIKQTHEAVAARNQVAHDFLQGSTWNNKRLVFMNGSTLGAQTSCIRAIMKNETDGDYTRAEAIFRRLTKDGVLGLDKPMDLKATGPYKYRDEQPEDEYEDPITRAMRAADALDRQTASLQPINELDLTITTRSRSNSLPLYGYADNLWDAAPFFVFGARNQEDDEAVSEMVDKVYLPRTPRFSITHYDKPSERYYPGFTNLQPPSPKSHCPRSPSCIGESYSSMKLPSALGPDVFTPRSDVFSIRSTDNVVYGEASLLDMRLSGRRASLTRVKSLDRIYPATPKYRDLCLPPGSVEAERKPSREPRRHSCMVVSSSKSPLPNRLSYIDGPRTIVVRSRRPTVKVSPVPQEKKRKPARPSYVDRGTDAEEIPEPVDTYKPVLPLLEDLVVYFRDEMPDSLLRLVIQRSLGNYPALSSPMPSEMDDFDAEPNTPESRSSGEGEYVDHEFHEPTIMPHSGFPEEYDPFSYVQATWSAKPLHRVPTVKVERPPTPAQTPPPVTSMEEKLHEFEVIGQKAPVAIQNSLRSVLKGYFPPETQGYRQFLFPLLPELEGLWRPIFRETDPEAQLENDRRMDQILAIGAQRGVRKDYASAITGQLEKLGTKSSGMSRSGRLDFRYLVANAMQAFTAQPLANQTHDNPFTNPYLLATLIIPHLETYLALHSEVKFLLLEYPPEHLPTMLALQKLVGVDLMKVAQIIDSKSKEVLQFTHLRGTHMNSGAEQTSSRYGSSATQLANNITVSKANFLLTSTASESEIATFVSTVSKILSQISSFYTPREAPKKPSPKKAKPSPLQGTFSAFPRVPSGPQSPPMSPALTARFGMGPPSRTPSIAETVKTTRSVRSRLSRGKSKKKQTPIEAQSIFTIDMSDSELDMEDRRIMPTLVRKPSPQKGNSRKALKFLGLA